MPIAHIHILEGRSKEQKQILIENITIAISESLDISKEKVRVLITEVPKENWGTGGITKSNLS